MEIPNGYVEIKRGERIPGKTAIIFRYPSSGWVHHTTDDGFTVDIPYGMDDSHVIAIPAAGRKKEW